MEPSLKKAKITGHFRVALRPQDINVQRAFKKHKKLQDTGQENKIIEVVTISDDDDDDTDNVDNQLRPNKQQRLKKDLAKQQQQQQQVISVPKQQILTNNNTSNLSNLSNLSKNKTLTPPRLSKSKLSTPSPFNVYKQPPGINPDIVDHDKFLLFDINCEPHYAWDSFQYDREQELKFRNRKYLADSQHNHQITPHIRARLVDWLVHIQDIFSLYHESLYMAVKLADQYLMRKTVPKKQLQLLYMTTILISAKFDERLPPLEIADLIKQSGGIYTRIEVIRLEVDILSTLNFNIRFPLSYGFLRRYSRCTRSDQRTLTLARYILESSLLDYEMIEVLESEIAAASLLLAFQMLHSDGAWTETAEFYTGYEEKQLQSLANKLNEMISKPTDKRISTVRNKYSHEVFMSVARIPPLCL